MTNRKTYIIPSTLITLTTLSALLLSSPNTKAEGSASVNLSVTVPSACSLTITEGSNLSTTIIPGNSGTIGTGHLRSVLKTLLRTIGTIYSSIIVALSIHQPPTAIATTVGLYDVYLSRFSWCLPCSRNGNKVSRAPISTPTIQLMLIYKYGK